MQIVAENDPYCAACEPCENFPPDSSNIGRAYNFLYGQRKAPCFNPLNKDEFIYVKEGTDSRQTSLVKYNLLSRTENTILGNVSIYDQPKWAKNGWIVFTGMGPDLFKVKDNGDSLYQITKTGNSSFPEVNISQIYSTITSGSSKRACILITDFWGKRLDSIPFSELNNLYIMNLSINNYDEMAGSDDYNLIYRNLLTKEFKQLTFDSATNKRSISGVCWHPNNTDIYYSAWASGRNNTSFLGINRINKNTKENVLLKKGCHARGYSFLSISPDGKKILVERQDESLSQDKGTVTIKSDIYMMDIDGRNEEKVFK
jgi:Tol biopolymer transport system component